MPHVAIDEIAPDATFRLRPEGDVSELAASIGRLGQLAPVAVRRLPGGEGKLQVVAGFRRLAALRLLQRERVLVEIHEGLRDDDAWAMALAGVLLEKPLAPAELAELEPVVRAHLPWAAGALEAVRARAAGPAAPPASRAAPAAATSPAPANPSGGRPGSQDPAAFVHALAVEAFALNQELARAYEAWDALPREGRALLLTQLRWLGQLLPLLERERT